MITKIDKFRRLNENTLSKIKTINDGRLPLVKAKDRLHLIKLIAANIKHFGPNCNLNYIDVSAVTDMSDVFMASEFNGDISKWDVSSVTDMRYMFYQSKFAGDISDWDVDNVYNMYNMFVGSPLESNPPEWYKK